MGKPKRQAEDVKDYEYVVVGSGAGGGPLASRLAIAGHKVLLIEAGDDQGDAIQQQVPALSLQASEYEPMRWDFWVHHYADNKRQEKDSKSAWLTPKGDKYVGFDPPAGSVLLGIYYPRSGTLGGCSAHNAEITIYPHDSDWTNIATITGDGSWAPDLMRKYFERLENNQYLPRSTVGHGFKGWLGTSLTDVTLVLKDTKLLSLVTAAASAMGQGRLVGMLLNTLVGLEQVLLRDINAYTPSRDSSEGLYQVPLSVLNFKRNGPRDFILQTANAINEDGSRKYHLDVKLNTLVTRVRFENDGTKPRATGVDFLEGKSLYRADPRAGSGSGGTPGSVNATKEVILAAGAYNSPQLLKLSGIGPRAELEKFQIPVLVDLPGVGTNLQDRYETGLVGKADSDFVTTSQCTFLATQPDPCLERWKNSADKGVYASNGIALAIVKKSSVADGDPDIIVTGAPAYFSGYFPGYSQAALRDRRHWTWISLKAHSRNNAGTVTLRSADPRDPPIINFNYFDTGTTAAAADEKDLQAVYEAMQFSRRIFRDLIPLDGAFDEVWPGPNITAEADLKDFIRNEAWGHHASCTCPIGADGDPTAVLDSRFRVRGVEGLRVVDASVFPRIPGYYVALPTYMISEKAADVIVNDA